jgi:uncharacterized protein YdhG (YjbR/CyaY superfamily)
MNSSIPESVNAYISTFPPDTQTKLHALRECIRKAAPKAEEIISYRMPAYRYHGVLVYFAGYTNHIGFYPTGSGVQEFKKELSVYKGAKGSVQFPIDRPVPTALVTRIVKFRMKENEAKLSIKAKSKTKPKKSNS